MNGREHYRPAELSARLAGAFASEASGVQLHVVKRIHRFLEGARFDPEHAGELGEWVDREQLLAAGEIYNRCLTKLGPSVDAAVETANEETQEPPRWAKRELKHGALDTAIDALTTTLPDRINAKRLARGLRGKRPPAAADAKGLCARLRIDEASYSRSCKIYERALFLYRRDRSMRSYRRGWRRAQQTFRMSGVLPAALARRLPLMISNQRSEGVAGFDPYGRIECSQPLRSGTNGLIIYLLGIGARPERFGKYDQVDASRRVLTSQTKIYQALAAVSRDSEPGGAGHKCVADWIGQLDGLQLRAELADTRGYKAAGNVKVDMTIPCSPISHVEKLVEDPDGSLVWAPWIDARQITKSAENTLRFTVAEWVYERVDAGDRIYFDLGVWRCLPAEARAMYLEAQGRIARTSEKVRHKYVEFYAADPWALRFGLEHFSDAKREEIILAGSHELAKVDQRVKGFPVPWHSTNSSAKTYRIYVEGRSAPSTDARARLRRADFLMQIEAFESGGQWPGRLGGKPAAHAPPDTS